MRRGVERMIRAAVALQVAALEFDADESDEQSEAWQALVGITEAFSILKETQTMMRRDAAGATRTRRVT